MTILPFLDDSPGLVNVYQKLMGKIHHAINGTTHYFDWAIFKFANCKRLPEAISIKSPLNPIKTH